MNDVIDTISKINLTDRQKQILELLGTGMSANQAAVELGVSLSTVEKHLQDARRRLGAKTRTHAVYLAAKKGLIAVVGVAMMAGAAGENVEIKRRMTSRRRQRDEYTISTASGLSAMRLSPPV